MKSVHARLAGFVVVLIAVLPVHAQELVPRLERELAARLIAEANQIRVNEVTVGPMQKVNEQIDRTWTSTGGVCVTFIAPQIDEGRRTRRVQKRVFFHDAEWGWYMFSIEDYRGGDGIDVVSERKGRIILR